MSTVHTSVIVTDCARVARPYLLVCVCARVSVGVCLAPVSVGVCLAGYYEQLVIQPHEVRMSQPRQQAATQHTATLLSAHFNFTHMS